MAISPSYVRRPPPPGDVVTIFEQVDLWITSRYPFQDPTSARSLHKPGLDVGGQVGPGDPDRAPQVESGLAGDDPAAAGVRWFAPPESKARDKSDCVS